MKKQELMERIGKNVRAIRAERKITQEQLADMLDKNASSITRIEGGQRMMSVASFVEMARVLGVSCDALVYDGDRDMALPLKNIIRLLRGQPTEIVESVERIVRVCLEVFAAGGKA